MKVLPQLAAIITVCLFAVGMAACELAPAVPRPTATSTLVSPVTQPAPTPAIGPTATASSFPVSESLLRPASYYLGEIESKYPAIAQAMSEFPWLANGITDDERWALDHILAIAEADLGTATSVVNLPLFNGEDRSLHRDFSASVRVFLIDEPDPWNQIIDRPWFQDGLTDEEAALLVVLSQVIEHQGGLFLDLIQDSRLRSETVSLPSG